MSDIKSTLQTIKITKWNFSKRVSLSKIPINSTEHGPISFVKKKKKSFRVPSEKKKKIFNEKQTVTTGVSSLITCGSD